jgi:AbrB family looped-hinge helix DNA binding protein
MAHGKITRNGQVTIPKAIRDQLRLREGMTVFFETDDGAIRIVPAVMVPKDQRWFWTREWQAKEREADEELQAGKGRTFKSLKALIKDLSGR